MTFCEIVRLSAKAQSVHWEAILVVLPCFSGYAALFGLQHEVKAVAFLRR